MEATAAHLRTETGVKIDVLPADLTNSADVAKVEKRLRDDDKIGVLINNAGAAGGGGFAQSDPGALERLIQLNVTAVTRLAAVAASRFAARGEGTIVNIASVVALVPNFSLGIYSATKSYVLTLSQTLQAGTRSQGRLCAGRSAGWNAHGDLGAFRSQRRGSQKHDRHDGCR